MRIVDAQVHIWAAETPQRPWVPGSQARAHRPTPFGTDELLTEMDRTGIERAFLVAPGWEGPRNDLVIAAARAHPDRLAALARFALDHEPPPGSLEELAADPAVYGFRAVFMRETSSWLTDGTTDWLWERAEAIGLPLCVYAPGQSRALEPIASAHPDLPLVVDHLGIDVTIRDGAFDDTLAAVLDLAALPNVAVKASSLPCFVSDVDAYPFTTLHRPIRAVVEAFGPDRVFWGSDLTRLTSTYAEARDLFLTQLDLRQDQLRGVMGEAICGWFHWP